MFFFQIHTLNLKINNTCVKFRLSFNLLNSTFTLDIPEKFCRKAFFTLPLNSGGGPSNNVYYKDGQGILAYFYKPAKMVIEFNDNLYVADNYARIRKITPSGLVTTLAGPLSQLSNGSSERGHFDGTGPNARFDWFSKHIRFISN